MRRPGSDDHSLREGGIVKIAVLDDYQGVVKRRGHVGRAARSLRRARDDARADSSGRSRRRTAAPAEAGRDHRPKERVHRHRGLAGQGCPGLQHGVRRHVDPRAHVPFEEVLRSSDVVATQAVGVVGPCVLTNRTCPAQAATSGSRRHRALLLGKRGSPEDLTRFCPAPERLEQPGLPRRDLRLEGRVVRECVERGERGGAQAGV